MYCMYVDYIQVVTIASAEENVCVVKGYRLQCEHVASAGAHRRRARPLQRDLCRCQQ